MTHGNPGRAEKILQDAMSLRPIQKAELVDKLLRSLDEPNAELDQLMAEESASRVAAYERGEIAARTNEQVFSKYSK